VWEAGPAQRIDSAADERRAVSGGRCQCGGSFVVGTQSHEIDERRSRHILVDHAQCTNCGRAKKFAFDISGYFEGGEP
jgi:hypothetical protein